MTPLRAARGKPARRAFRSAPTVYEAFTDFSSGLPVVGGSWYKNVSPIPWPQPGQLSWDGGSVRRTVITTGVRPGQTHALQFTYPANVEGGPEQPVAFGAMLGGAGGWIEVEYWIKLGDNFASTLAYASCKWNQFFEARYTYSATFGLTYQPIGIGTNRYTRIMSAVSGHSPEYGYYGLGQMNPQIWPGPYGERFMSEIGAPQRGAIVAGQWHKFKMRADFSTAATAYDGWYRVWVDDVLFTEQGPNNYWSNDEFEATPPVRPPAIGGGYLMGYSNQTFAQDTQFTISEFRVRGTRAETLGWSPP